MARSRPGTAVIIGAVPAWFLLDGLDSKDEPEVSGLATAASGYDGPLYDAHGRYGAADLALDWVRPAGITDDGSAA